VCKVLLPKVKNLRSDFPDTQFVYVNTEKITEAAGQHLVFAVPTILIFNEGKEVTRFSRHFGLDDLVRVLEIMNN
jgi:thioredoxin-like negative regulator of GroEL